VRILAVHDRPEWSMAHHCDDLRAALEDDCTIDIRSCGRNWEGLQQLAQSIDASYDRIYVAGELLGQYFFKLLPEPQRRRTLLGVHSYFLWDGERSVGSRTVRAADANTQFFAAAGLFAGTVVICNGLQTALAGVATTVAHYGINTDVFHPLAGRRPAPARLRVGWTGALIRHKNHRLFADIRERLGGVVDCEEVLMVPEQYLSSRPVRSRSEMNEFYNTLDVLVVTAESEGGPLPPLEAAACGVPTITPPIGCMPEFIRDGVDGYLLNSYEADDYVRAITRLHENRDLLDAMRRASLDKAFGPWRLEAKARDWLAFLERPCGDS